MNWIDKFLLNAILFFIQLFKPKQVSIASLKMILKLKLTMDNRRPNAIKQTRLKKKADKPTNNATIFNIVGSLFTGLLYLFAFLVGNDLTTQLTIYFSMFITLLCLSLISDFTNVLIDTKDTYVILPLPISDQTFLLSRICHIIIHLSKIVIPMSLPGAIAVYYNASTWLTVPAFFITILLLTIFCIFLVNAVYIFILKFLSAEKFKSIIANIQIGFAVLVYAAYQILPRLMDRMNEYALQLHQNKWLVFYPPYWFSSATSIVTYKVSTISLISCIATLCAVCVPLLSILIVVKVLAPTFNQKIAMINGGETRSSSNKSNRKDKSWGNILCQWLTKSSVEKAGFLFTWNMMLRSRDFRLKVYPSIGYFIVIIAMMILRKQSISTKDFDNIHAVGTTMFIAGVYFTSLMLLTCTGATYYSEKYKSSWIFYTTPIHNPGEIISGSLKASIAQFFIPTAFIIVLLAVLVCGVWILPNIIFALENQLLIVFFLGLVGKKMLPFSYANSNQNKSQVLISLFRLLIFGILAFLHIFFKDKYYVVYPGIVISFILIYFFLKSLKSVGWSEITIDSLN